jgi:YHS domain-containing protein
MFRALVYLLSVVLIITVVRMVLGVIAKGMGELLGGGTRQAETGPRRPEVPMGGELKRDPVCGTYVPAATAVKKPGPGGEVVYFCSTECRDRYTGQRQ